MANKHSQPAYSAQLDIHFFTEYHISAIFTIIRARILNFHCKKIGVAVTATATHSFQKQDETSPCTIILFHLKVHMAYVLPLTYRQDE